ncbi:MAG: Ig-like domain-containing protein [Gemmatimonadales bacterium]
MQNATTGPLTGTVLTTKAESLAVRVTDAEAAPVAGVPVSWASAGGTVSGSQVATNANGHSMVEFTYGATAGTQTVTASASGVAGSPVTITLTATAGTAAEIVKASGSGDGGTAAPSATVEYTVTSTDAQGNAKGGVMIDWEVASGGGSITPPTNVTGTNGTASATRTLSANTGAHTATATAADLPGSPSVTFTTTAQTAPGSATVDVSNNNFSPASVTISDGGTITWEWQGTTDSHNVTFATAAGAPSNIDNMTSGSAQRTFNTAGTFNYSCTNHAGMDGTVTVQ